MDNQKAWLLTSKVPWRDADGEIVGLVGYGLDITNLKKTQIALEESETMYRNLINNAGETIVVIQDGRIVFVSPSVIVLLGYTIQEVLMSEFSEFVFPSDQIDVNRYFVSRLYSSAENRSVTFRMVSKTGETLWVQSTSSGIEWKGQQAILSFVSNITQRKQAELIQKIQYNIANAVVSVQNLPVLLELVRITSYNVCYTKLLRAGQISKSSYLSCVYGE